MACCQGIRFIIKKTSGEQSEAAYPIGCLAELFSEYHAFLPQNVMVQYESVGPIERPAKMNLANKETLSRQPW